jgi:hypothetical protein
MKVTAAEWSERVASWRASGKSAFEFAEAKGYAPKLLRWWASELRRRERDKPTVQLAQVRVRPSGGPVQVIVGGARIEVRAGFDAELLRSVVEALGGPR